MTTDDPISFRTMLAEARREVAMRRHVFSKRVEAGAMEPGEAAWSIAIMEAIAAHLEPLAAEEQRAAEAVIEYMEPRLF